MSFVKGWKSLSNPPDIPHISSCCFTCWTQAHPTAGGCDGVMAETRVRQRKANVAFYHQVFFFLRFSHSSSHPRQSVTGNDVCVCWRGCCSQRVGVCVCVPYWIKPISDPQTSAPLRAGREEREQTHSSLQHTKGQPALEPPTWKQ